MPTKQQGLHRFLQCADSSPSAVRAERTAGQRHAFEEACRLLGRDNAERILADNDLRMLALCGIEIAGCATGWTATIGNRQVTMPRFHATLDRALAVENSCNAPPPAPR